MLIKLKIGLRKPLLKNVTQIDLTKHSKATKIEKLFISNRDG